MIARHVPAVLALASLPAVAQEGSFDPSRMLPVSVPVRDAGTFDWQTKTWIAPGAVGLAPLAQQRVTVYDNTCTWVGGSFYYGMEHCEDLVDSGRIPATNTPLSSLEGNPGSLIGVRDDQIINNFQLAYCTTAPSGSVDIKIGFYDNLRGHCADMIPVQGKPFGLTLSEQAASFGERTAYFDFGPVSDWALPGATTNGVPACWTFDVTFSRNNGFCLKSEGDGTWDNSEVVDHFSWSFEHDIVGQAIGPIIAGDPGVGAYGAGSYGLPGACGTGFGNSTGDGWWLNIDGGAPGVPNTTSVTCPNQAAAGTNCYWFGGWPVGPLGSFHMVLDAVSSCSGCDNQAVTYCTSGTSYQGCQPMISASGTSSANASSGFFLDALAAPAGTDGVFFFGTSGRTMKPWGTSSSFVCVAPPLKRTPLAAASAPYGGACGGGARLDLNALWTQAPNKNPGAGSVVQAQYWYRDPLSTSNRATALTNAVEWSVCP